jgi:ADP-heptose:LPS heptosyltransferase
LGDVIYTMPVLSALKESDPKVQISWLVGKSSADLLRGHPLLSRLFILNDKDLFSKSLMSRLSVVKDIIGQLERTYDLVLVGHRDPGYTMALRPFIWGPFFQLSRDDSPSQIRHMVHVPPMTMHESLAMKKLLEAGLSHVKKPMPTVWSEEFKHIGAPSIPLPENFLALHVGGGVNAKTDFSLKQWPHTGEFLNSVLSETNLNVVLLGTKDDRTEFEKTFELRADIESKRLFNIMGETSVRDLVSIIRRSRIFVGPDSGPLHIADLLNIPSLGLYGPTSPISWGLLGKSSRVLKTDVPCSPCYKDVGNFPECGFEHRCMKDLSVMDVKKEFMSLLLGSTSP